MERELDVKPNGHGNLYDSPLHEPSPPLEGTEVDVTEAETDMSQTAPNYTALPNWLMPILFVILFSFFGFVYTTVDRRIEEKQRSIDKLEGRLELQETYTKNSREWLIAHGWDVDEQGHITKSNRKK